MFCWLRPKWSWWNGNWPWLIHTAKHGKLNVWFLGSNIHPNFIMNDNGQTTVLCGQMRKISLKSSALIPQQWGHREMASLPEKDMGNFGWYIMTSLNGRILRITDPLWVEPPVPGRYQTQRASNADLWCYFVVSLDRLLKKQAIDR